MVDCDYCGESFGGEDAYLDHLADSHEGELGSIDQRRVDSRASESESGLPVGAVIGGIVVVLALGAGIYVTQLGGNSGTSGVSPDGVEAASLDSSGNATLLANVSQFPSEGRNHVSPGTDIQYSQTPPLSGTHYGDWSERGYFEEPQEYGYLVHSLEHGAVIIYYDEGATSQSAGDNETAEESLREFVAAHSGQWRNVIVAPNPEDDPQAEFVVTAWRHRLYMDDYDADTVHAFLSEFLGRGPENPVR